MAYTPSAGALNNMQQFANSSQFAGGGVGFIPQPGNTEELNKGNFDLPGYSARDSRLGALEQMWGNRQAPQSQYQGIGQFERAGLGGGRNYQEGLAQQLWNQARGQGPSLANESMRQGVDQGINAQQSLAATGRGNAALAQRQAAQGAAGLTSGMAGQGALNRMMEQQAAQQGLAGVSGQMRGQDLQANQFDASQQNLRALEQSRGQNQSGQFNAQMQQGQMGLNQQGQLGALGQQYQNALGQQAGNMTYEQMLEARRNQPGFLDKLLGVGGQVGAAYLGSGGFGSNSGSNPNQPYIGYPGGY